MAFARLNPVQALRQNPFVLAPMAGITDHPFRSFMRKMGTGLVVTELVSATGIEYKSDRTLSLMSFDEGQRPVGIQLFGEEISHVARGAQVCEEMGADFVDLNFGCPVPKVVKKGAGSAMLKDLPGMTELLKAVVSAVKIPVTIKIRTGWDAGTRNADEVVKIAYNEGISWVAIHGRTRAQAYNGQADWDYIAEVKSQAKLPIIGNGDILFAQQAVDCLLQSGCDGVMIGRGALKNPYIFRDALALYRGEQPDKTLKRDFGTLFIALKVAIVARCEDRITQIQLKKFAAWFATGYPGAAQFRKQIFQAKTTDEVTDLALNYFNTLNEVSQADTSSEAFLMGGHG
jgi:tRNA-dihydrouridine synthase B